MATHDFTIEQGADYSALFVLKNQNGELMDLGGYDCKMQVRRSKSAHALIDELSLKNGRLSLDVEKAEITLNFPNEITKKYPPMSLVYDFEMYSSQGRVTRLVEGAINVIAEVTRDECC